jgi:hypothetical protein
MPIVMTQKSFLRRHSVAVTIAGTLLVTGAVAAGLAGKRGQFEQALSGTPIWILGIAVALHIFFLIARSEAWNVCVDAAGGTVKRGRLYEAASVGYLGNLFNGQFGMVMRVAALRRAEPENSPRTSVLLASELPIIVVEAGLAVLMSFTLIGPLGIPWWVPLIAFAVMAAVTVGAGALARKHREGFWNGLAVMRGVGGRNRIFALIVFAIGMQIARNYFLLRYTGVDASVLDSVALLIGVAVIGLLPVGPSAGIAATVLILGTNGVAPAAAAGALLTATAAAGTLCFASWALLAWLRGMAGRGLPAPA